MATSHQLEHTETAGGRECEFSKHRCIDLHRRIWYQLRDLVLTLPAREKAGRQCIQRRRILHQLWEVQARGKLTAKAPVVTVSPAGQTGDSLPEVAEDTGRSAAFVSARPKRCTEG
ncbi:hypothetical protein LSTR_LSTR006669 [Laodelphax striatellus]|uniref:Uncharacterized protein n=1 Tax=Laodelphax striatellus TaxID=195883 RepID=A0A482X8N6_LAOST|nr:hypothetical protein LSTR_LSTR006669 [Laodelphax striatellus]